MENKNVGLLIIGIAIVMAIVVWIFNVGLKNIVGQTCTHGPTCSMYDTISTQTYISLAIVAVILVIGIVIMLTKPKEKIIIKTLKQKKKKLNLEGMNMCDKLLRRLNPEVNLEQWHEYGRKMVEFAENLARAVGETLERPNIFNYDLELPKGIF